MKRITTDDKVRWIFKYLVHRLNPVVVGSHLHNSKVKENGKVRNYNVTYLDCKVDTTNFPDEILYPFSGMIVYLTSKHVCIVGANLYYKFPTNFLLTLQERFNEPSQATV